MSENLEDLRSLEERIAAFEVQLKQERAEHQAQQNKLEKQIDEAKARLKRIEQNRDDFPPGFNFRWNDRRGDPQFIPYYALTLHNSSGQLVWVNKYREELSEEATRVYALRDAWELVDIAAAIVSHEPKPDPV